MSFYLKKYMWIISVVAVVLCSYFLAKLVVNFVATKFDSEASVAVGAPVATGGDEKNKGTRLLEEYKPIVERNFFDSKAVLAPPTSEDPEASQEEQIPTGEAVATQLKIKLVSTFVVGDGLDARSSCVLSAGGKEGPQVYTVNDKNQFSPDTKITKITYNRIEFIHKGRLEFLEIEDFAKGIDLNKPPAREEEPTKVVKDSGEETKIEKKAEGTFVIDRAEIDAAIANLDKLYTQVRAVPHFKEGKPNGLKLLSVRSDSIFSKLGLRRGDVLQKINGMELDIKKGLEIFNQLKNENKIAIELERKDSVQTLEYEIR